MYIFRRLENENTYEKVVCAQPGLATRIWNFLTERASAEPPAEEQPFPWHMHGNELLGRCLKDLLGEDETARIEKYKLIADVQHVLAKSKRNYAELYEVSDIFGYSGSGWTPMMWKLRMQFQSNDCGEAREQNRWKFDPDRHFVYEFLYLQADHRWQHLGGRRDFGPNGKYNGALLCPDALKYFISKIDLA